MTGTIKVGEHETVIRLDNGNSVHAVGGMVTVWERGGKMLWRSVDPAHFHSAVGTALFIAAR